MDAIIGMMVCFGVINLGWLAGKVSSFKQLDNKKTNKGKIRS